MRRGLICAWFCRLGCGGAGSDADTDAVEATETSIGDSSSGEATSSTGASNDTATGTSGTSEPGSTTTSGSGDSTGETGAVPFEHVFYTVITDEGRLALQSNLPWSMAECVALPELDVPCEDADADELVDAWEDVVLDRLRPLRRFDEEESAIGDASAVFGDVGRVTPGPDAGSVRLYVMLGYSYDYGSCGFTSHNGDSERVALDLAPWPEGGAGGVVMAQAYTAAHEGTVSDHGRVYAGADLGELVMGLDPETVEPRWVVFPSADKHATYASIDVCEGISVVPCFDEDCGPDGVADPSMYDVLPVAGNAGEAEAPRLTELSDVGFPGDDAWAEQDFCGGLGGSECSSSVREKLTVDPF